MNQNPQATTMAEAQLSHDDVQSLERLRSAYGRIRSELAKVIVGQEAVLEQLLVAIFSQGHCLLEGVPGLAKTLMVSTLARSLHLSFTRIQFTPDLMPSDITGTEVIDDDKRTGSRSLRFVKGPVFANVILADEINRTPPKTQSALLEAMQDRQVTAAGCTYPLPNPFFVLATQNPIEQEGTYPLPEAQLDRFMFKVLVDYPSEREELDIVRLTTAPAEAEIRAILSADDIIRLQETVRNVPCSEQVMRYATTLARWSRRGCTEAPQVVQDYVAWGAGPRASQNLVMGGKARALLHGRHHVSIEDIRQMAYPVLRHRIITNFNAEADGVGSEEIIKMLIEQVPPDPSGPLDASLDRRVFAQER